MIGAVVRIAREAEAALAATVRVVEVPQRTRHSGTTIRVHVPVRGLALTTSVCTYTRSSIIHKKKKKHQQNMAHN